jgi:hypothetical protein
MPLTFIKALVFYCENSIAMSLAHGKLSFICIATTVLEKTFPMLVALVPFAIVYLAVDHRHHTIAMGNVHFPLTFVEVAIEILDLSMA